MSILLSSCRHVGKGSLDIQSAQWISDTQCGTGMRFKSVSTSELWLQLGKECLQHVWTACTVVCGLLTTFPYKYWWNFLTAKIIAKASFSVCAYLDSANHFCFLHYYIINFAPFPYIKVGTVDVTLLPIEEGTLHCMTSALGKILIPLFWYWCFQSFFYSLLHGSSMGLINLVKCCALKPPQYVEKNDI